MASSHRSARISERCDLCCLEHPPYPGSETPRVSKRERRPDEASGRAEPPPSHGRITPEWQPLWNPRGAVQVGV